MLIIARNLICDARDPEMIDLLLEIEMQKAAKKETTTEIEIQELVLTKKLVQYMVTRNYDQIYSVIIFLCSHFIRNEIVPDANWTVI